MAIASTNRGNFVGPSLESSRERYIKRDENEEVQKYGTGGENREREISVKRHGPLSSFISLPSKTVLLEGRLKRDLVSERIFFHAM